MTDAPRPWRWKVAQVGLNDQLDLLYEPGNWGDVLKGTWALAVLDALLARRAAHDASPPLALLDPWAGAPTWPLVAGAAERLATLPDGHPFVAAQRPFLADGRLASTGRLLIAAAAARGARIGARAFDLSPARRAAWTSEGVADLLDVADGADALTRDVAAADLLLVDPYDLHATGDALVPRALGREDGATLFYLYNKAPQGAPALARYERLRDRLASALARDPRRARRLLVGRIPSDARLPRAFHEMWLVAAAGLVDVLREPLRAATHELAAALARSGAFEDG